MKIKTLNTILYGPPGTGKTYSTIQTALQVVLGENVIKNDTRTELTTRYKNLLIDFEKEPINGQIAFTTFHQSMSYEDFIEGIKPIPPDKKGDNISYEVKPGIFKQICDLARKAKENSKQDIKNAMTEKDFNAAQFIKINFQSSEIDKAKDCINKGIITHFDDVDIPLDSPKDILKNKYHSKFNSINDFIKNSDNLYFIITVNEVRCLGIGKANGAYNDPINEKYKHSRAVKWFIKTEFPLKEILKPSAAVDGSFLVIPSDSRDKTFRKEFFTNPSDSVKVQDNAEVKKYVLIIDEINRGNIAQIFGELITLIEDEKREGLLEELSVVLPYSKTSFSVPDNVYIIGTMNTADRSVEALDTALRRRFSFIELAPNEKHEEINKKVTIASSAFNFQEILETINKRIEKLVGRDHKIGHSYFIHQKDWTWENYLRAFTNKIVPLMQEYFFGDYGKMCLVLGKGFVDLNESHSKIDKFFADAEHDSLDEFTDKPIWELKKIDSEKNFAEALKLLLNK